MKYLTQAPHRSDSRPTTPDRLDDWQGWVAYGLAWSTLDWTSTDWTSIEWDNTDWESLDWDSGPGFNESADGSARPNGASRLRLDLTAYREERPGSRWQALFNATWPAYRAFYLREGAAARPSLREAESRMREHLPELMPTWRRLVELTGHHPASDHRTRDRAAEDHTAGDDTAARLLTMWRLPTFAAGCTQAVIAGSSPVLARNYDYDPNLFERVIASTNYSGRRRVIGTSDMLWGLLDGMNEDGLAVSLTYGGRPARPDDAPGFAVPIVLRYVLETCANVHEAIRALERVPVAQAYNIALVDTGGAHATVFVAPGEAAQVSDLQVSTNHRLETVEFPSIASPLESVRRQDRLADVIRRGDVTSATTAHDPARAAVDALLAPPLRRSDYRHGFGTLYTACYRPAEGTVTYSWPDRSWTRTFDDGEGTMSVWVNQD